MYKNGCQPNYYHGCDQSFSGNLAVYQARKTCVPIQSKQNLTVRFG